jgi:ribosomal protein S18 acetylase RimI-like enzyme
MGSALKTPDMPNYPLPVFHAIRPADEPGVRAMIHALYLEDGHEAGKMSDEKISRSFEMARLEPGHLRFEVFEMEEQAAGYALLWNYWSNEYGGRILNIDELFVIPRFRGRGIAKAYFLHLSKMSRDYAGLSLEVMPGNHRALEFYTGLGFRSTGRGHLLRLF